MSDTEKRLAEIRERAEKAGKKLHYQFVPNAPGLFAISGDDHSRVSSLVFSDIPFLLAEIERLKTNQRPHKEPTSYVDDDLDVKGF